MTRLITIEDLRAWGEDSAFLDGYGGEAATLRQILDESRLSLRDRGRVLSRALAERDRPGLVAWAQESADLAARFSYDNAADYADLAARAAACAGSAADGADYADYAAAYAAAYAAYAAEASTTTWVRAYTERLEACVTRLEQIEVTQ
jgi:hypothetical protein